MRKILEVANMKININPDEKEKAINNILSQIMLELEAKTSKSIINQLKDVLISKPFGAAAMAGLTAVVVLTPNTTNVSISDPNGTITSPDGTVTTPEDGNNPGETIPPVYPPENSFASSGFEVSATKATFTIKDEFLPETGKVIELFNGNQFIKTLSATDFTGSELEITGLAPNTEYDDFYLVTEENNTEAMVFTFKMSNNNTFVSIDNKVSLGAVTTDSDPVLEAALEAALERQASGDIVSGGTEYSEGNIYLAGDKVLYNDAEFEAMWWTSEAPTTSNLAWKQISNELSSHGNEIYNNTKIYEEGHEVEVLNEDDTSTLYVAKHWVRGVTPSASTPQWSFVKIISEDGTEINERTWSNSATYERGDIVTFDGIKFMAKWEHSGITPDINDKWGVWNVIKGTKDSETNTESNIETTPEWNNSTSYTTGQTVTFNGIKYIARHWTKDNQPDLNIGTGKAWDLV